MFQKGSISISIEKRYWEHLFALGRFSEFPARSPLSLRIPAVAAGPTASAYTGIVAAPQATTEPFELSILVQTRVFDASLKVDGFC
jgi:hypothetical protein